jgi:Family of unknown function (DUF6516)
MKADLILKRRQFVSETAFLDLVVWRVPTPVRGSQHDFKYRLALVTDGVCVMRYDNEAGKGDHRHTLGGTEEPYVFTDWETLVNDFLTDVETWRTAQWER